MLLNWVGFSKITFSIAAAALHLGREMLHPKSGPQDVVLSIAM
jgi:hypothetical protein